MCVRRRAWGVGGASELLHHVPLLLLFVSWDFSALHAHAELDAICPQDNDDVLWCASFGPVFGDDC